MRYQLIIHTCIMLHHASILNEILITTIIEMVEILDRRVGKDSVERVRFVLNKLAITLSLCEI